MARNIKLIQALMDCGLVLLPDPPLGYVIYTDDEPPVWVGQYWPKVNALRTQVVFRFGDLGGDDEERLEELGLRAAHEQLDEWEALGFRLDIHRVVRRWDLDDLTEWTFTAELLREETSADEVAAIAPKLVELGKMRWVNGSCKAP